MEPLQEEKSDFYARLCKNREMVQSVPTFSLSHLVASTKQILTCGQTRMIEFQFICHQKVKTIFKLSDAVKMQFRMVTSGTVNNQEATAVVFRSRSLDPRTLAAGGES